MLGIEEENFKKKYPQLSSLYSNEEIEKFDKKFVKAIALGVALILIGVIILIFLYGMKFVNEESTIPVVILMFLITIATPMFIYFGIQKDKYDIEKYNIQNSEEGKNKEEKAGKICAVIMLTSTAIFLATGFIFNVWKINWIVFAIGGILCGIVSTVFEK